MILKDCSVTESTLKTSLIYYNEEDIQHQHWTSITFRSIESTKNYIRIIENLDTFLFRVKRIYLILDAFKVLNNLRRFYLRDLLSLRSEFEITKLDDEKLEKTRKNIIEIQQRWFIRFFNTQIIMMKLHLDDKIQKKKKTLFFKSLRNFFRKYEIIIFNSIRITRQDKIFDDVEKY